MQHYKLVLGAKSHPMVDNLAVNVIQVASSVFPSAEVADCVFISVVAADKYLLLDNVSPIPAFDLAEDNVSHLDLFMREDGLIEATLSTENFWGQAVATATPIALMIIATSTIAPYNHHWKCNCFQAIAFAISSCFHAS